MKKRKVILGLLAFVLIGSAIADGVRYLRPARIEKPKVLDQASFPVDSARYIVLVYNANGGIFPGIADFAHKVLAPSTYPCRLCYLTFGTFTMKAEWRSFLASLPFQKTELHKDDYRRSYRPSALPLPAILVSDSVKTQLLATAAEINQCKSLDQLKKLVSQKLQKP